MIFTVPMQRLAPALGIGLLLLAATPVLAEQAHFPSPEAAAQALVEALAAEDQEALNAVLGPELDDLRSEDPIDDAQAAAAFVENALLAAGIEQEGDDRAVLTVGPDDWPFAIPLARDPEGWYFDTAAGREELIDRRIGRNEFSTIEVARAYVEAQEEYAEEDRNGDGVREFAQKLMSSEGARDGLFWPTTEEEPESPMGSLVGGAVAEGYTPGEGDGPSPYHGYFYRILMAQGEHAPHGAKSYLEDGRLTKGFGLVAWPAEYGNAGIMTFQVNQSGIVYQKDLGDHTAKAASAIDAYDPDDSWEPVTD